MTFVFTFCRKGENGEKGNRGTSGRKGRMVGPRLNASAGLQITVGHRTMADQNFLMSDEIATLVGHFVRPIFVATFD